MFTKFYAVPNVTLGYGFAVYGEPSDGRKAVVVFITSRSLPDHEALAMFEHLGIEVRP